MALPLLRASVFILIATMLMVAFALYSGHNAATSTVTEYMEVNARLYPISIRDTRSAITLHLAGRRCFAFVPLDAETLAVRMQYERGYAQQFQVIDSQPDLAVNRLRCP